MGFTNTKLTKSPSRQIRPPIYSLKQSKLRKRRVVRYAILYFLMFFLFLILMVGPAIAGKYVGSSVTSGLDNSGILYLLQPTDWNNNDTTNKHTGTATQKAGGGAATSSGGGGGGSSATGGGSVQFSNPFGSSMAAKRTPMFVYA